MGGEEKESKRERERERLGEAISTLPLRRGFGVPVPEGLTIS